jgi:hypothetical protein
MWIWHLYPHGNSPIESTFAMVLLRTCPSEGPGSRAAGLATAVIMARKA